MILEIKFIFVEPNSEDYLKARQQINNRNSKEAQNAKSNKYAESCGRVNGCCNVGNLQNDAVNMKYDD